MKRRSHSDIRRRLLSLAAAGVLALAGAAGLRAGAGAETVYRENDWNFVDGTLNAAQGIPEDASGQLRLIRNRGVLRVATDAAHPPRTFLDPEKEGEEQYAGADIELARRIAERMGVRLQIVVLAPERVLPSLLDDQCDLAISALGFTPGRGLSYTMSRGYDYSDMIAAVGVLVKRGTPVETVSDMEGMTIIAQSNSLAETVAVRRMSDYGEFRRAHSAQAVGQALEDGTADAAFVDIDTSRYFIQKNPDTVLELVEGLRFIPNEAYQGYRAAARKGEAQLMYFVNGVIEEVTESGEYAAWLEAGRERAKALELQ